MHMTWYIVPLSALIPMLIGFIWYNPKVFGTVWMQESGMTLEKARSANMAKTMGLALFFSLLLGAALSSGTIHQLHINSVFDGDATLADPNSESSLYLKHFYDTYGTRFRTFKHGALHGFILALMVAVPAIGYGVVFEMKSFRYAAIHMGYLLVSMSLQGGFICQFL